MVSTTHCPVLSFLVKFVFFTILIVSVQNRSCRLSDKHILEIKRTLISLDQRLEKMERTINSQQEIGSGSCDCAQSPTYGSFFRADTVDSVPNLNSHLLDQLKQMCTHSGSRVLNKISSQLENLESWNSNFMPEYESNMEKLLFNRDCEDFRRKGHIHSGIYVIYPVPHTNPMRVQCDMESDNGGWTIIQSRGNFAKDPLDFHRDWITYKQGFGNPESEFWLGNEAVHLLTNRPSNGCALKVELRNSKDGRLWVAHYERFALGSEDEDYVLKLGSYSGNATDGLYLHHNRPFRTWDREEDPVSRGCAWLERSGWWHHPVASPPFRRLCSYPLGGTNLNAPPWHADGGMPAPEVQTQVMTLQVPSSAAFNQSIRLAFIYLGNLYWMDKDGRHFDQVQMKIRPNY